MSGYAKLPAPRDHRRSREFCRKVGEPMAGVDSPPPTYLWLSDEPVGYTKFSVPSMVFMKWCMNSAKSAASDS